MNKVYTINNNDRDDASSILVEGMVRNDETEYDSKDRIIYIPKAYARGESNKYIHKFADIPTVECYELHLTRQLGTVRVRRDTYVYVKLPSGYVAPIILYMDGGVGFDKLHRKQVLRELDKLDRSILLGYCKKYQDTLFDVCHVDHDRHIWWLQHEALSYRAEDNPKRIKQGSEGNDFTRFYTEILPCDESALGIFSSVVFI